MLTNSTNAPEPLVTSDQARVVARAKEEEPRVDHLVVRLLVLGVGLGLAHFWAQRHLDWPLLEKLEGAPLISVLLPSLAELLGLFGGKSATKGVHAWVTRKALSFWRQGLHSN